MKKIEKEVATLEAKKAKADAKAAEEAKKAEAESVLKKLLAEGMSVDEILAKQKLILSILVDTFSSRILNPMLLPSGKRNIVVF